MPWWETEADRKAEREIIAVACDRWRCEARKAPPKYGFDFCLLRGRVIAAVAEVRDRRETMDVLARYGGPLFSAHKVERCLAFAELAEVPSFLIIRCGGTSVYYTAIKRADRRRWRLEWFDGNREARHENDKEPVFVIPSSDFLHITANFAPVDADSAP